MFVYIVEGKLLATLCLHFQIVIAILKIYIKVAEIMSKPLGKWSSVFYIHINIPVPHQNVGVHEITLHREIQSCIS